MRKINKKFIIISFVVIILLFVMLVFLEKILIIQSTSNYTVYPNIDNGCIYKCLGSISELKCEGSSDKSNIAYNCTYSCNGSLHNSCDNTSLSYCDVDSDCVAVPTSCCGVTGGGIELSINKKYENEYLKDFGSKYSCENTMCLTVMGKSANLKCVNKKCT